MKTSELITCVFLFIMMLAIAHLSVNAIENEQQANHEIAMEHQAYLASHQTKEKP